MNVRRSAAVCRGQAAASGCASRVDRHIINRLAVRIRETEIQSLFKAATSGDEQAVVVRVTTRILEEDLTKLPIRPKEIADINLAIDEISQASDIEGVEIRCPAVQGAVVVVGVCRGIEGTEQGEQHAWRLAGYTSGTARTVRLATLLAIFHSDVERVEEARSVNGDLVQVVRSVEMCSSLPNITDFRHQVHWKLTLNGEVPLVHGGVLEIGIERAHSGGDANRLGRRGQGNRGRNGRGRYGHRESRRDSACVSRSSNPGREHAAGGCSRGPR